MGFNICNNPRKHKRGGGVGFLYKSDIKVKPCKTKSTKTFELLEVIMTGNKQPCFFSTIYRTGILSKTERNEFLQEIQLYVASLIRRNEFLVIWGDFNIHVESSQDVLAKDFLEVMETLGFKQIVQTSTHIAGGTLDLIFVKKQQINYKIKVLNQDADWNISDHYLLQLSIPNKPLRQQKKLM